PTFLPSALVRTPPTSSSATAMFTANKPANYTFAATDSPAADSFPARSSADLMVQVIARSTQTTLDCPPSTPANSPLSCTVTVQDTASGTKSPPVGTVSVIISGGPAGSTSSVTPCALAPTTASSSSCTVMFTANKPGNYTI